ncbi:hypothetical protein LOC68_05435 [Blastopirellula sp. JC732]|uniref:Transporter n=1 Tax=Blastopirellula sediminis TaxID=2894196 RepID=A0A9X1MKA7_9BACT|nr:hypothetical protein [Blastopirellula sediminis]MCC9609393.1 hypothetical protein [Blastopirellula sediminis]MCC9627830.1 hypothetical protein [Blastopirellula sediminis]
MRPTILGIAFLLCVGFGFRDANAEEATFVTRAELDDLYARLAEHERLLASDIQQGACCSSPCYPCSTCPGVTFAAELLLLKPFQSEGEAPGFDYHAAPRISLGYTGEKGLGFNVRWFDYDASNPNANFFDTSDIQLTVVDFEINDKFELGHWQGLISGGLRYADYQEFSFGDFETMEDSWGPVLGVQLTRPLTEHFAIFATARSSFQYAANGLDNGFVVEDMTFTISELQLGAQFTRPGRWGGEWYFRGAFEGQYWSGGTIGDGDTEDLSLAGGMLAIGLTR